MEEYPTIGSEAEKRGACRAISSITYRGSVLLSPKLA